MVRECILNENNRTQINNFNNKVCELFIYFGGGVYFKILLYFTAGYFGFKKCSSIIIIVDNVTLTVHLNIISGMASVPIIPLKQF